MTRPALFQGRLGLAVAPFHATSVAEWCNTAVSAVFASQLPSEERRLPPPAVSKRDSEVLNGSGAAPRRGYASSPALSEVSFPVTCPPALGIR